MATNIFYSVSKFGTANLLSGGSPTIVVDSSGNATVTLAGASLVDNIGVGVAVQYNSITSYIDSITSTTSFHLVTALGVNASVQTSTSLTSINHEYVSLADFEAGFTDVNHVNNTDLTSADVVAHACCYYDHDNFTADNTGFLLSFGNSDATRYLKIFTPQGGTESINNQRNTSGTYDDTKYRIEINGSPAIIEINSATMDGTQIEGIQFRNYGSGNGIDCSAAVTGININHCFVRLAEGDGILLDTSGTVATVSNCIIYNLDTAGSFSEGIKINGTVNVYNCTVYNFNDGIERDGGTATISNCVVFGCSDDFDGSMTITNCASDDGDGSNPQTLDGTSSYANEFTSIATGDFSLVSSGVCEENGTNLSGSGISDDIIGTSRPQGANYDIGGFELIVATGTNMNVNIGDTWKDVEALKINIGDSWKEVVSVKINIGDSWKTIY